MKGLRFRSTTRFADSASRLVKAVQTKCCKRVSS